MQHPMFDNSYDPSVQAVDRMTIEQLFELNETDPQKVVDYGKLRCNETVVFFPSNITKAYNLISSGHDHIFITCLRNGALDYIWLGQFTSKDWDGFFVHPQIECRVHHHQAAILENHAQRIRFLANKTLITETVVSEYKNYWDGCMYKYAAVAKFF